MERKALSDEANKLADILLALAAKLPDDDSKQTTLAGFASTIKKDTADNVLDDSVGLKKIALQLEALIPDIDKGFVNNIISLSEKAEKLNPSSSDLLMTLSKDYRTLLVTGSDFVFDVRAKSDGTISVEPRNGYMNNGTLHGYTGGEAYPAETVFANKLAQIKTTDQLRDFLKQEMSPKISLNWNAKEQPPDSGSSFDGPYVSI